MSRRARVAVLIAAFLLAVAARCATRVAPHDEQLAAGLAGLQTSHQRFFDELRLTAGTPEAALERHHGWYEATRAEVTSLRERAAAYGPANRSTVEALELLAKSIDELEAAHGRGLAAGEIPVLRTLFDSQLQMLIRLESAKKRGPNAEVTP
jgi:hypothetical protein